MAFTSPDLQLTALSILTAKSAGESLYQIPAPSIFLSFRSQKRQWAKFLLKDSVDCNKLNLSVTRSTDTVQGSSNRRAPGSVNAAGKLSQKW